jgi:hypothetical protein
MTEPGGAHTVDSAAVLQTTTADANSDTCMEERLLVASRESDNARHQVLNMFHHFGADGEYLADMHGTVSGVCANKLCFQ